METYIKIVGVLDTQNLTQVFPECYTTIYFNNSFQKLVNRDRPNMHDSPPQ